MIQYPKDECLYEEGLYHITIYGRLLIMEPREYVKAEIFRPKNRLNSTDVSSKSMVKIPVWHV